MSDRGKLWATYFRRAASTPEPPWKLSRTMCGSFPKSPTPTFCSGEAYINGTWMEQAISHFQKAVELNPRYARAVYALAAVYKFIGDHEKAKTFLHQVLALDANHVRALLDLGELLGMEREYEKAVALLERATALQPSFADSFLKLGSVHLLQKKA